MPGRDRGARAARRGACKARADRRRRSRPPARRARARDSATTARVRIGAEPAEALGERDHLGVATGLRERDEAVDQARARAALVLAALRVDRGDAARHARERLVEAVVAAERVDQDRVQVRLVRRVHQPLAREPRGGGELAGALVGDRRVRPRQRSDPRIGKRDRRVEQRDRQVRLAAQRERAGVVQVTARERHEAHRVAAVRAHAADDPLVVLLGDVDLVEHAAGELRLDEVAPGTDDADAAQARQRGEQRIERRRRGAAVDRQRLDVLARAARDPRRGRRRQRDRELDELRHRRVDRRAEHAEPAQRRQLRERVEPPLRARTIVDDQQLVEQRRACLDDRVDELLDVREPADRDPPHEPRDRHREQRREPLDRAVDARLQAQLVDEAVVPADPARRQQRRAAAEQRGAMLREVRHVARARDPVAERIADRLQPVAVDQPRRRVIGRVDDALLERRVARGREPLGRHALIIRVASRNACRREQRLRTRPSPRVHEAIPRLARRRRVRLTARRRGPLSKPGLPAAARSRSSSTAASNALTVAVNNQVLVDRKRSRRGAYIDGVPIGDATVQIATGGGCEVTRTETRVPSTSSPA